MALSYTGTVVGQPEALRDTGERVEVLLDCCELRSESAHGHSGGSVPVPGLDLVDDLL